MFSELKGLFASWTGATAAAIDGIMTRIVPRRRILLVERESGCFTALVNYSGKGTSLAEVSFYLVSGSAEPPFIPEWEEALRGSSIEVILRSDQLLFCPLDFPKAAADFLEGMVRAQIDRLTPWPMSDAVFGMTEPQSIAGERIALLIAATSRQKVQPLIDFAERVGAVSVAGLVEPGEIAGVTGPIRVFQTPLPSALSMAINIPLLLSRMLLGGALVAAASFAISIYLASALDTEQEELLSTISQRRAALRLNQTGGSAEALLVRRKHASPSSVMVLESISRVLPDSTYVTELRIEGDKMQVVGLTQDAPSLIKFIEQSPQFERATFFAPTTRDQNEPGERFHIEAHIKPYFGYGL